MKASFPIIFFLVLQNLSFSSFTHAVEYVVINDAQNTRFEAEIGVPYTKEVMKIITYAIWDIFQQYNSSVRSLVETVTLYIDNYNDGFKGYTFGQLPHKYINISSKYLIEYQGDLKWEFTSLLHHMMTHVFQWQGDTSSLPHNLLEGIADYTVLTTNYYPTGFAKRGYGENWDQGYDVTARFLEYCEELRQGFVAGLNQKMKDSYNDDFFMDLIGKSVDQLWSEYKATYDNN